jgi:hypothetical protein
LRVLTEGKAGAWPIHGGRGFLADRDQDVRDPLAVEQGSVHLWGKLPLVRVSIRGRRGLPCRLPG